MENLTQSENKLVKELFLQVVDLNEFEGCYGYELKDKAFNDGWVVFYNRDCEESVLDLGIWSCLGLISRYEKGQYGEIYTRFDEPFNVANMVAYIWGKYLLQQSETYQQLEDEVLTEGLLEIIIAEISEYAEGKDESELFDELCEAY